MKTFLIVLFFVGTDASYPVVVKGLEPREQTDMTACEAERTLTEQNLAAMDDMPAPYLVRCAEITSLMDLQRVVDDFLDGADA